METFFEIATNPKIVGPVFIGGWTGVMTALIVSTLKKGKVLKFRGDLMIGSVTIPKATTKDWFGTIIIFCISIFVLAGSLYTLLVEVF